MVYQTSKPKAEQSLLRHQRSCLENGSQCPHQVRILRTWIASHKRPYQFDAMTHLTTTKGQSFVSFPSSPASGWTKSCMGTQPSPYPRLIPAFDCHRAGRLPSGSLSQESIHSCWPLVTPYPGGGSISIVKQQILKLWLTASKSVGNCVIFLKTANSFQFQWSSIG